MCLYLRNPPQALCPCCQPGFPGSPLSQWLQASDVAPGQSDCAVASSHYFSHRASNCIQLGMTRIKSTRHTMVEMKRHFPETGQAGLLTSFMEPGGLLLCLSTLLSHAVAQSCQFKYSLQLGNSHTIKLLCMKFSLLKILRRFMMRNLSQSFPAHKMLRGHATSLRCGVAELGDTCCRRQQLLVLSISSFGSAICKICD